MDFKAPLTKEKPSILSFNSRRHSDVPSHHILPPLDSKAHDSVINPLPPSDALLRSLSASERRESNHRKSQELLRLSSTPPSSHHDRYRPTLGRYEIIPSIPQTRPPQPYIPGYFPETQWTFPYPWVLPVGQPLPDARMPVGGLRQRQRRAVFKKEMTRREAALVLQKHFKGYRVRRNIRFFVFLAKKRAAYDLVNEMIDSYLTDEVIPTLLIEVLTERRVHGGLDPGDPLICVAEVVCEEMVNESVGVALKSVVSMATDEMIHDYMLVNADPSNAVYETLSADLVGSEAQDIVREVISDEIGEYFLHVQGEMGVDVLLQLLMKEVVESVIGEDSVEQLFYSVFDSVVTVDIKDMAEAVLQERALQVKDEQIQSVAGFAGSRMLDELILKWTMTCVGGQAEGPVFTEYSQRLLDATMAGHLLQQVFNVCEAGNRGNFVLEKMHSDIFTETAIDVVLDKLVAHLDEDMADYEQL